VKGEIAIAMIRESQDEEWQSGWRYVSYSLSAE
jgi:hypothetical protein